MSVSFVCLSNARGYTLDVPGLQDIWNRPCRWQGKGGQHSSKFVALSALSNRTLLNLLETEQLVPDPREHAKVFRNEELRALEAEYASIFAAHIVVRTQLPPAPPPAAPSKPSAEEVAAKVAEIAAAEAAARAEAEALVAAEAAAEVEAAAAAAAADVEESVEDSVEAAADVEDDAEESTEPARASTKKKKRR